MQRVEVYEPMKKLIAGTKISKSLLRTVCWLNSNIQRYKKLPLDAIHSGLQVACAGLFTEDADIISDCLWAINYMADTDNDILIGQIAGGEVLPKIIQSCGDKDFSIFVPALRALGNILTTNDHTIVERALFEGALEKLTSVLYGSNSNVIKEVCWALSNIVAGPPEHIMQLVDSSTFERVMYLAESFNIDHKKEALWVIVNAITGGDAIVRQKILHY